MSSEEQSLLVRFRTQFSIKDERWWRSHVIQSDSNSALARNSHSPQTLDNDQSTLVSDVLELRVLGNRVELGNFDSLNAPVMKRTEYNHSIWEVEVLFGIPPNEAVESRQVIEYRYIVCINGLPLHLDTSLTESMNTSSASSTANNHQQTSESALNRTALRLIRPRRLIVRSSMLRNRSTSVNDHFECVRVVLHSHELESTGVPCSCGSSSCWKTSSQRNTEKFVALGLQATRDSQFLGLHTGGVLWLECKHVDGTQCVWVSQEIMLRSWFLETGIAVRIKTFCSEGKENTRKISSSPSKYLNGYLWDNARLFKLNLGSGLESVSDDNLATESSRSLIWDGLSPLSLAKQTGLRAAIEIPYSEPPGHYTHLNTSLLLDQFRSASQSYGQYTNNASSVRPLRRQLNINEDASSLVMSPEAEDGVTSHVNYEKLLAESKIDWEVFRNECEAKLNNAQAVQKQLETEVEIQRHQNARLLSREKELLEKIVALEASRNSEESEAREQIENQIDCLEQRVQEVEGKLKESDVQLELSESMRHAAESECRRLAEKLERAEFNQNELAKRIEKMEADHGSFRTVFDEEKSQLLAKMKEHEGSIKEKDVQIEHMGMDIAETTRIKDELMNQIEIQDQQLVESLGSLNGLVEKEKDALKREEDLLREMTDISTRAQEVQAVLEAEKNDILCKVFGIETELELERARNIQLCEQIDQLKENEAVLKSDALVAKQGHVEQLNTAKSELLRAQEELKATASNLAVFEASYEEYKAATSALHAKVVEAEQVKDEKEQRISDLQQSIVSHQQEASSAHSAQNLMANDGVCASESVDAEEERRIGHLETLLRETQRENLALKAQMKRAESELETAMLRSNALEAFAESIIQRLLQLESI